MGTSEASLLLSTNVKVGSFNIETGHSYFDYKFLLDQKLAKIFDVSQELESSFPEHTKMALVYIVGYIMRNDSMLSEEKLWHETTFYHQTYGQYLDEIEVVTNTFQRSMFCFILFNAVKEKVCRKTFCDLCMFSE